MAVLSVGEEECLHVADHDAEWVVVIVASYHTIPNRDFFMTYKVGDFGMVKMGNTNCSKILGIGDVQIKIKVGDTMVLKDVQHVPDLRLNLISEIALDKQGYGLDFGNGT